MANGAVRGRGVRVLVGAPKEEDAMVALVIGVDVDIMLVVLLRPMLLEVVDGHPVGNPMRLTIEQPTATSIPWCNRLFRCSC